MKIRTATLNDLDALTAVEAECFPAAEAATKKDFENRLAYYADHFWLMFDENDKLIAFVDGMVTDEADLTDEMYEKGEMHNENGAWQMIFGVNTIPSCRIQEKTHILNKPHNIILMRRLGQLRMLFLLQQVLDILLRSADV